ncbi:GNAT family N-acetyltransferase [Yoonia sp. 208BN28-4]|uniref:GNAT family N-acetyltransferase n=1 Tax=Yoonia sp. 208BN28-4 TaxID=3126505 RepID=UPI00309AFAD2
MHTLTTQNLTLRPYQRSDFDAYAALMTGPRAQHMGGPHDSDGAWRNFVNDAASFTLNGFGCFIIVEDATPAGFAGMIQPPDFPEPEIGWGLYDGFEGRGIITRAARAILDDAFATTGRDSFVSYITPDNAASIKVAERLGAVRDDAATPPAGWNSLVYRHTPKGAAA